MSHRSNRTYVAALATLTAIAALAPASAHAQLGKLKKAAADAAKDKAGVKSEVPASNNSSSNSFVITTDRLAAVIAVMETSMERAAKVAAARAVEDDYNKKHKTFQTCLEGQVKSLAGKTPSMDAIQKATPIMQKSSTLGDRMVKAQQANRYREYIALTDTMQNVQMLYTMTMYGVEAKCGAPVYMPAALIDANADKMASASNNTGSESDQTVVPAAQRAGMTTHQFGMVRERAALWALQQTNNAPADNNKYGIFTSEEQTVLDAQGPKLKKWAPIFKASPSTWSTWGDLKSW